MKSCHDSTGFAERLVDEVGSGMLEKACRLDTAEPALFVLCS